MLTGINKAQSEYGTCENSPNHLRSEVDKLQQLQTAVVWARGHKAITEQYERLKLFPGKFYKAHKMDIDRYLYAVKQLTDSGITHLVELGAFTEQLKLLETELDVLSAKRPELREVLRMWCACEVYMRELLNLPKPPNIPDFSVQSKSERQQHAPEQTHEHKQKVPAKTHQHDDRGRSQKGNYYYKGLNHAKNFVPYIQAHDKTHFKKMYPVSICRTNTSCE